MEGEFYSMLTTPSNCVSSLPGSRITLQVLPPSPTRPTWSVATLPSGSCSCFLLVISAPIDLEENESIYHEGMSEGISGASYSPFIWRAFQFELITKFCLRLKPVSRAFYPFHIRSRPLNTDRIVRVAQSWVVMRAERWQERDSGSDRDWHQYCVGSIRWGAGPHGCEWER